MEKPSTAISNTAAAPTRQKQAHDADNHQSNGNKEASEAKMANSGSGKPRTGNTDGNAKTDAQGADRSTTKKGKQSKLSRSRQSSKIKPKKEKKSGDGHEGKGHTNNASMSQIPMEYLTPAEESDKEVAIKGRRHSVPMLSTGYPSQTPNESTDNFHHPSTPNASTPALTSDAETKTSVTEIQSEMFRDVPFEEQDELFESVSPRTLLPPVEPGLNGRKCLVLDLDETLVHSSFKYLWNADFVIPVEIDGVWNEVYVVKRPGVDEFISRVSQLYEIVVFTASVSKYGNPLLDHLDPNHAVHHRLFRESCSNRNGTYVKDLSVLGRPLESIIIIDNSPAAYSLNPHNAIPVSSWFSDVHDSELMDMVPFLEDLANNKVPDVINILRSEW